MNLPRLRQGKEDSTLGTRPVHAVVTYDSGVGVDDKEVTAIFQGL